MEQPFSASALAREVVLLLLTLAAGVVVVAAIVFLPEWLGRGAAPGFAGFRTYLGAVGEYLGGLLRGELGVNARGRTVNGELFEAARRSMELLGISFVCALALGLAWGAGLAATRGRPLGGLFFALTSALISLPTFTLLLLLGETVARITLNTGVRLAYVQGYGLDGHLILPVTVLSLRGGAYVATAVQAAQEHVMAQDYITAARARGLGGLDLWRRQVLPALRLPLLGAALGAARVLVGAMVIVDFIFAWGGLGRKMLSLTTEGIIATSNGGVAAGAGVLLLLLFVVVDTVGRIIARGAVPQGGAE